jgi:hypothetical protein
MAKSLAAALSNVTDETYQHHIRACSDALEAMKEAQAEYKGRLKAAKSDGCNSKMLAVSLKDRSRDPDRLRGDMRDRIRILALLNIPVVQAELFTSVEVSEDAAATHNAWEADGAGYKVGLRGGDRDENPHTVGTELYGAWDTGYRRGQAKIAKEMAAPPKKRGRKAAGGNAGLPM